MKEYKILTQDELFGYGMLGYADCRKETNKAKAEVLLNKYAKEGWRVVSATSFYQSIYYYPAMIILERDIRSAA